MKKTANPMVESVRDVKDYNFANLDEQTQQSAALPLFARVARLDFLDYPFEVSKGRAVFVQCVAEDSHLGQGFVGDEGGCMFVCSDTEYTRAHRDAGLVGQKAAHGDAA